MTFDDDRSQERPSAAPPPVTPPPAGDAADMPVIRVPSQQDLPVPPPPLPRDQSPQDQLSRPGPPPLPVPVGKSPRPTIAVFGDVKRSGRWRAEPRMAFYGAFGDVKLDFREAEFTQPTIHIQVGGLFSDTKITVTPGTRVEVRGGTVFGDQKIDEPTDVPANGLTVMVTINCVFGDLRVYRLNPGEARPKWWQRKR